jgi:fused signal recognition particle receptor
MFWRRPKPPNPGDIDPDGVPAQADVTEPGDGMDPTDDPAAEVATMVGQPLAWDAVDAPGVTDAEGSAAADLSPAPSIEAGLRPSRGFVARLRSILGSGTDEAAWEAVEETLIAADIGARLAIDVVEAARRRSDATPVGAVQAELRLLLVDRAAVGWSAPRPDPAQPAVILVVGVNGTGKTTSIAKLAARYKAGRQRVLLAAADTFRAAAIEQLQAWARRLDMPVVAHAVGADPSAVVFDALDAGLARHSDVVIIDTAGRLHTKHNLMDELAKIRRTIDKRLPGSEPAVLFVLDATTGQNGLTQAQAFNEASGLTGILLSKLDSTSKGGIVFAIERTLGIPVLFVGVGERLEDLVPFDPDAFIEALFA